MNIRFDRILNGHLKGASATHPQAALAGRMALLLLLAGNSHAASSRLAIHPDTAFGRIQLKFLG